MILDKDGEIERLQSVLREIVAMVELPSVSKVTSSRSSKPGCTILPRKTHRSSPTLDLTRSNTSCWCALMHRRKVKKTNRKTKRTMMTTTRKTRTKMTIWKTPTPMGANRTTLTTLIRLPKQSKQELSHVAT